MRFLKAERIFDGKQFIADGMILALNERSELEGIIPEKEIENNRVEQLEGTICPGFVNTHCHLELSHMQGKIQPGTGLTGFAKGIMQLRPADKKEEVEEYCAEADKTMFKNGIVAVGDISNNNFSFNTKANSRIHYHSFIELIGLHPAFSDAVYNMGLPLLDELRHYNLKGSLTPHAPYSVSKELIKKLAEAAASQNLPMSIHNQESEEELNFLEGKKNKSDSYRIEDLYAFLNLDLSWYKAPGFSGLKFLNDALTKNKNIMVHNTFSTTTDVQFTQPKNISWCFCPNANLYIENRLPTYEIFKDVKDRVCLGTDSLASNQQLDLISEANVILKNSKVFSTEDLLAALTSQGAEALGISASYGKLIKGKNAGLNLIKIKQDEMRLLKKIC